jgi:hypothetical protein
MNVEAPTGWADVSRHLRVWPGTKVVVDNHAGLSLVKNFLVTLDTDVTILIALGRGTLRGGFSKPKPRSTCPRHLPIPPDVWVEYIDREAKWATPKPQLAIHWHVPMHAPTRDEADTYRKAFLNAAFKQVAKDGQILMRAPLSWLADRELHTARPAELFICRDLEHAWFLWDRSRAPTWHLL